MLPIHKFKASVFNYDEIPPGYYFKAMISGGPIQRFWHREKFQKVAESIRDGEDVLDIGCGPGSFLHILANQYPNVKAVGTDLASGQIDFARENIASQFQGERVQFVTLESGLRPLPFADGSFDKVTCIEVIEHIHPMLGNHLMREAARVLKPGGKLIVTTPNYRSFWPLIEKVLERLSSVKYHEQHISKFTPNSLVKFVEVAGFEVQNLDTIFVAAPFLAPLARSIAAGVHRLEQALPLRMGSLLVAECAPIHLEF